MPEPGELRRAWQQMTAPPPYRALEEEDPLTQEAVAWLRAAWSVVPAPSLRPRSRSAFRIGARPAAAALAVAATLLLAALGVRALAGGSHGPAAAELAQVPEQPPEPSSPPVQMLAQTPERLEMRSGPVRLTVFHKAPAPASKRPPTPSKARR